MANPRSSQKKTAIPADPPDVFLSYSRKDVDFVSKLARDLEAVGLKIWRDQHIEAGTRWDREVERALAAAPCLLVVLSPDSVGSDNVLDEASRALDQGKLVIPILYRSCAVPLRFSRLQYLDFRPAAGEHAKGLETLKQKLHSVGVKRRAAKAQEGIVTPISSFSEALKRAQELLDELEVSPPSELMMVVVSPDVDLYEKSGRLRHTLETRIEEGGITKIVCLSPHANGKPSDLCDFCASLATKERAGSDHDPALMPQSDGTEADGVALFERGWKAVRHFHKYATIFSQSFGLKFANPQFQLILVKNSSGVVKFIFYVSRKSTSDEDLQMKGFYSEDPKMGETFQNLFNEVWENAEAPPEDTRSSKQCARDAELQIIGAGRRQAREWPKVEVSAKFGLPIDLHMKPGVFPPDIALAENDFVEAIEVAARQIWGDRVPRDKRIGIDVGTGTGLLALLLSRHCDVVVGTDIDQVALENFNINTDRYLKTEHDLETERYPEHRRKSRKPVPSFVPILCHLLQGLKNSNIPLAGRTPLIVFNHPYYPSPSNMFHVGGNTGGGAAILTDFLKQAKPFLSGGGAILLPDAELAGTHRPAVLAPDEGYDMKPAKHTKATAYGNHSILLFTLKAEKASRKSHSPSANHR